MAAGLGEAGRSVTAGLAVLLTMGAMNAYVAAAVKLAGALAEEGSAPARARPPAARARRCSPAWRRSLLVPLAFDVIGVDGLVRACSAAFVAVYVAATAAGVRLLDGAGAGRRGRRVRGGGGRARVQRRVPGGAGGRGRGGAWPVVRGARAVLRASTAAG